MANFKHCKFYKEIKRSMVKEPGQCDLDSEQTTCNGDIDFCEKPLSLKKYLFEQLKKQGGLEWKKEGAARYSGNRKT